MHKMKLTPSAMNQIKSGLKTIELRLFDEKRQTFNVGDPIEFTNMNDKNEHIMVQITDLFTSSTFAELAKHINIIETGYANAHELIEGMLKLYPIDDQKNHKVVGIEFKII